MRFSVIFVTAVVGAVGVSGSLIKAYEDVIVEELETRQQPAVIASANFLRRGFQATAVCGNSVYIDGGDFSYLSGNSTTIDWASSILSIDLSTSWTNSSVTISTTAKPSDVPDLLFGNLWCNESTGNLISGLAGGNSPLPGAPALPALSLWSFNPNENGGTWDEIVAADDASWNGLERPSLGYIGSGGGKGYVFGGVNASNSAIALPGMVSVDLTTLEIKNATAGTYDDAPHRGVMHYVPAFGPDGVFVILGGYSSVAQADFGEILLFDGSSGSYYTQNTTGNVPGYREQFCTAGATSSNGTYEIFMYAGWAGQLGPGAIPYDEIYILTLPAFTWVKVQYDPEHPRHALSCETVGNRQMLVIGGVDTTQGTYGDDLTLYEGTFDTKDQFTQGLAIFDMTALEFTAQYDADAEAYEQSASIQQVYAGNAQLPASWNSVALQTLFKTTHFPNATTTTGNSTISGTSSPSSGSKKSSNTGAIAGGVVGGVLGLALIAGAIFFLLRRRRNSQRHELDSNANSTALEMEDGSSSGQTRGKDFGYSAVPNDQYASAKAQGMLPEMEDYRPAQEIGGRDVVPELRSDDERIELP